MKKIFLTLLVFALILVPVVSAFEVQLEPIIDRVPSQGIASFELTIDNPSTKDIAVGLSLSPSQAANWITSPNSVSVPAMSSRTINLTIIPKPTVNPSQYNLLFSLRASTGTSELIVPVRVVSVDSVFGFQPHIVLTLDSARQVDPRELYSVSTIIRNQNPRNLEGLVVEIGSPLFQNNFTTDIGPSAQVSREIQFQLNPLQTPGVYEIYTRVFYPLTNTVLYDQSSNFEIIEYSEISPVVTSSSSWFKTTDTINLVNNGNVARVKEVSLRMPFYKRLFLSTSHDFEVVKIDGKSNIQWAPLIQPAEEVNIVIVKNYRFLVVLALLAALGTMLYYLFRSSLVVEKHVFVLRQVEEGVSDLKIRLYIRNRSRKPVYNISVSDILSRITEFVATEGVGTLKPSKVTTTTKKGTILNWHFDTLDSLEERIVTYKVKSTLSIVGDLTLPKARVKFENSEGKESFVDSSSAKFFTKQ